MDITGHRFVGEDDLAVLANHNLGYMWAVLDIEDGKLGLWFPDYRELKRRVEWKHK